MAYAAGQDAAQALAWRGIEKVGSAQPTIKFMSTSLLGKHTKHGTSPTAMGTTPHPHPLGARDDGLGSGDGVRDPADPAVRLPRRPKSLKTGHEGMPAKRNQRKEREAKKRKKNHTGKLTTGWRSAPSGAAPWAAGRCRLTSIGVWLSCSWSMAWLYHIGSGRRRPRGWDVPGRLCEPDPSACLPLTDGRGAPSKVTHLSDSALIALSVSKKNVGYHQSRVFLF